MAYSIHFTSSARKQFDRLPHTVQGTVESKIDKLAINPRPHGVEKLQGEDGLYRIRVGDYRVVYQIAGKELTILVLKIGHRREIYRRF